MEQFGCVWIVSGYENCAVLYFDHKRSAEKGKGKHNDPFCRGLGKKGKGSAEQAIRIFYPDFFRCFLRMVF